MSEPLPAWQRANIIKEAARISQRYLFVETGSADGSMIAEVISSFSEIYSIDLNHHNYRHCFRRFARDARVRVLWGNSSDVLWDVMEIIAGRPAVFWLDAHEDGPGSTRGPVPTPIWDELKEIMGRNVPQVILIDDARFFGVDQEFPKPGYPSLEDLKAYVAHYRDAYSISVADDVIRIIPKGVNL